MLILLNRKIQNLEVQLEQDASLTDDVEIWVKDLMKTVYPDEKIRIYGPVGGRPIHICALSADRFGDMNFYNMGNIMKRGILNGMMQYLEEDGAGELFAEYGKDYCALLGSYMERTERRWANQNVKKPPFWRAVEAWHKKKNCAGKESAIFPVKPTEQMKQSVTVGLYEGETIVFPLIASGDAESVNHILHLESKAATRCAPDLTISL